MKNKPERKRKVCAVRCSDCPAWPGNNGEEADKIALDMGRQWMENSSLERWFPYTAEELQKLRAVITEVYLVASGERQVTNDDTAALAWIAERCKKP